ncbi:MAG: hypothetical protein DMF86_23660, partial [Acidobacteria bacterium]
DDELGPERAHDAQRFLDGVGGRDGEVQRGEDRLAARGTAFIVIGHEHERCVAVGVLRAPAAAGQPAAIGAAPAVIGT